MGIRFYCPQGHKLNVKEFQAGRKGICPFCGVKLQIPLESTRPSSRGQTADAPDADAPEAAQTLQEQDQPAADAAEQTTTADPLVAAGNAVWYVRPAGGGQFGPASADVMRAWLAEGRLAADTYVWREGWREWQLAGGVFEQLVPVPRIPGLENIAPQPASAALPFRQPGVAKAKPDARLMIVGTLVGIVVVLSIIFIIVMSR